MTDAQTGGMKGNATTDHLLTLKEAIRIAKSQRKKVYPNSSGCNQGLPQGMDRCNYVRNVQRGTEHENMVHHQDNER